RERGDYGVAAKEELTKLRAVKQVRTAHRVMQLEVPTTWQHLAPQEFMALTKSGAIHVRVSSGCVGPEVKRGVDHHGRQYTAVERRRMSLLSPLSPDCLTHGDVKSVSIFVSEESHFAQGGRVPPKNGFGG